MGKSNRIKGVFACECGASVTNRLKCDDCVRTMMLEKNYSHESSLMTARMARLPYFYGRCPRHLISSFTTKTNTCQICDPPRSASARVLARKAGKAIYLGRCDLHGETDFSVNSGKCLTCFNAIGVARPSGSRARATARAAGHARYFGFCETCGPATFAVNSGKCLTCYTATGAKRARPLDGGGGRQS